MMDYIKISLYTLVAVFIITFSLPIYQQANDALDKLKQEDKSMVHSSVLYSKYSAENPSGNYVDVYKYVIGVDALEGQTVTTIEVNGRPTEAKEVFDKRSSIYDILTLLNTFCIQGKYMDCDRLYFKDRYITKASSTTVSLRSALANLDVSGDGKYIMTTNGKDCRFIEVDGSGTIFVKGE